MLPRPTVCKLLSFRAVNLPKLDVAGSIPVSRSNFATMMRLLHSAKHGSRSFVIAVIATALALGQSNESPTELSEISGVVTDDRCSNARCRGCFPIRLGNNHNAHGCEWNGEGKVAIWLLHCDDPRTAFRDK